MICLCFISMFASMCSRIAVPRRAGYIVNIVMHAITGTISAETKPSDETPRAVGFGWVGEGVRR